MTKRTALFTTIDLIEVVLTTVFYRCRVEAVDDNTDECSRDKKLSIKSRKAKPDDYARTNRKPTFKAFERG